MNDGQQYTSPCLFKGYGASVLPVLTHTFSSISTTQTTVSVQLLLNG